MSNQAETWPNLAAISISDMVAEWYRGPARGDQDIPSDSILRRLERFVPPTSYVAALQHQAIRAEARIAELEALINRPETADWLKGAQLEAAHQIDRWGAQHDIGKTAWDWFWLIRYLAQKAAAAQVAGDDEKAKHHTISTAAALLNWHRHLTGADQRMRPGIDPIERGIASPFVQEA